MDTEKNVVVEEVKTGEVENRVIDNNDVELLTAKIFMNFKADLPFKDKNTNEKFIKYMFLIGIDEEKIYSFFNAGAGKSCNYYKNKIYRDPFEEFFSLFIWHIGMRKKRYDNDDEDDDRMAWGPEPEHIEKADEYVIRIAEYIVKFEPDLLAVDSEKYVEQYKPELDSLDESLSGKRHYYDFWKYWNSSKYYREFYPLVLLKTLIKITPEKYIPIDFMKIIPGIGRPYSVEYLPVEPSDIEKTVEHKRIQNIAETPIYYIRTKKDFYDKWNFLVTSRKQYTMEYRELIKKWGEHFPVNLLKKEIENKNNECIDGVLESDNKYAIKGLLAFLNNKNYIINKYSGIGRLYISSGSFNGYGICDDYKYYKLLIGLSEDLCDNYDFGDYSTWRDDSGRHFVSWGVGDGDKFFIDDIVGIIKSNSIIGQKISKTLEKRNINLTCKLTIEQLNEIERLEKLSSEYEEMNPRKRLWPKNEFETKIDDILNADKTPLILRLKYVNKAWRPYVWLEFWLYERHGFNELNLISRKFDDNVYNKLRYMILEKPFFFPEYSGEHDSIIRYYFSRELNLTQFERELEQQGNKRKVSWRNYWRRVIENIYRKFEQMDSEDVENSSGKVYKKFRIRKSADSDKPMLPIVSAFGDILLSKTDNMFSTAIENVTYYEYTAFLTECRQQQINKLCKKGALESGEANDLIAMAECKESNYYAWSDWEIKKCLLPETNLEKLHAGLEPEFMVKIFEKSILWVVEHRDSELWQTAPWFGMQIFNKSYADRPSIWAKHLLKIVDNWTGSENMLLRMCFAIGHLREPCGGDVLNVLQNVAERQKDDFVKGLILKQRNLFYKENINKGHYRKPSIRVDRCKEELITGQNIEVDGKNRIKIDY